MDRKKIEAARRGQSSGEGRLRMSLHQSFCFALTVLKRFLPRCRGDVGPSSIEQSERGDTGGGERAAKGDHTDSVIHI